MPVPISCPGATIGARFLPELFTPQDRSESASSTTTVHSVSAVDACYDRGAPLFSGFPQLWEPKTPVRKLISEKE